MVSKTLCSFLLLVSYLYNASAVAIGSKSSALKPMEQAALQNIVTWDKHSISIRGERIMVFSGEFHPFRLPVTSLWLDIFQKLKAAGYGAVSFYSHWALLEGKQGNFTEEGVFAFEPFFQAASEAGLYLIARPGAYINAEVTGGGFPGWLQRDTAIERTPSYIPLTANYIKNIGRIIAKAQITNGGPVILVQPENEYSQAVGGIPFPDKTYFSQVEQQLRDAGIVVPFISNDAYPHGYFAPGTGQGAVDIYGYDGYPLGFDCANPYTWPQGSLPDYFLRNHLAQSPNTPNAIGEFQGGSFDPWGGVGFEKCTTLLNEQFERVFFKNNYAAGVTSFNQYMVYGGTNWGNLGHPGGYTSYDYGAIIKEDRTVTREKYSEVKLQGNFFRVSPAYLTATPENLTNPAYSSTSAVVVTRLVGNPTNFYIARQDVYNTFDSNNYKLTVPSSAGYLSIPQLSSYLTLNGRDSKVHSVDYDVGGVNMLYSTAEIFTWKKYSEKTVLVVYGAAEETHELAFCGKANGKLVEGSGVNIKKIDKALVINWSVSPERKVVKLDKNLYVYLLNRNDAYNYWVLDLPAAAPKNNYTTQTLTSVIVRAGYLLRTASISGSTLHLTGDLNCTTTIEVVGSPLHPASITFNGQKLSTKESTTVVGALSAVADFQTPKLSIPDLSKADWKYIDSLPEVQPSYSDALWTKADHTTTKNTVRKLTTPVSLYASDYGYNTGAVVTRGTFTANGAENILNITTQGGSAFATAVYLDSTQLNGYAGNGSFFNYNQTMTIPTLKRGYKHTITIITDNMGLDEDFSVGSDGNKNPRGVLDYNLSGHSKSDVTWKITGNLGGEDYRDFVRGPLNEGGMFAERQGYHLPNPPTAKWESKSPLHGISKPGIGFYTTNFNLNMPAGYDIPMSFVFTMTKGANYRVQLFINGWQFGKFVNNVGPQTSFPVPEGILNYHGSNTVSMTLWGFDATGNKIEGLKLVETAVVQTGYPPVVNSASPAYGPRKGAY